MKIQLHRNGLTGQVEMFFYYKVNDRIFVAKPIDFEMIEVNNGDRVGPTLAFNMFEGDELLKDLAEQIDKQGIKTTQDAQNQGSLDATKKHLEDMRALVFKGDK